MKNLLGYIMVLTIAIAFQSCDKATASANEASILPTGNNKTDSPSELNAYQIGDVVEDFSLKGIDDKMTSMASFPDAEGYIVIFTCNTCPYSKEYESRIIDLTTKYSNDGWPVIAINPNDPDVKPGDSFEAMKTYAAEKGFNFPYLFDDGQKVYPKWGANKTPHVFIVEKQEKGNVLRYIGAIDDNTRDASKVTINYVDNTIAAIRAGEKVEPDFTKAIGCSIKTK